MGLHRAIVYTCEGADCKRAGEFTERENPFPMNIDKARRDLQSMGWFLINGNLFCPECAIKQVKG